MLEGRGVDLFMIETFYDLEELVDAIEAVRGVSALPIVALLTFDEGAETLAGVDARARRPSGSRALDVAAIGANHGGGLLAALDRARADGRRRACRSRRCRTSASRACPAAASSTRTRRRSTSPSSPRTRATSARA